jgi:hypothetical protein
MVDDIYFFIALRTSFEGVVEDGSIEPCEIIEDISLIGVVIFDLIGEEFRIVEFSIVNDDIFGVVGCFYTAAGYCLVSVLRIIGVSECEVEISKIINKYQNGYLVLSEHCEGSAIANSDIISETTSGVN